MTIDKRILFFLLCTGPIFTACTAENRTISASCASDTLYAPLTRERIFRDISLLPESEYERFLTGEDYRDKIERPYQDGEYAPFYTGDRCLIHVDGAAADFGPLEADREGSLVLLYSKHAYDAQRWKLDTVLCTYPEFSPLKDSSAYFCAGSQRCKLGDCEWFYTLLHVEGNTFQEYFSYYSFDRSMFLEQLLLEGETKRVEGYLNDTLYTHYDLLRFDWQGDRLKGIHLQKRSAVLKGFHQKTLVYESDSSVQHILFRF